MTADHVKDIARVTILGLTRWSPGSLRYLREHGGQWGDDEPPGTCAVLRKRTDPESFVWAHDYGCPCDCYVEDPAQLQHPPDIEVA